MKKLLPVIPVFFLLVGCDPIYHLNYIVTNESDSTICFMAGEARDTVLVKYVLPGKSDTVRRRVSVGYARPVFDEDSAEVRKQVCFFTDPRHSDSTRFFPSGQWKYSETNRCEGKAVIIVTQSDITH